MLITNFAAGELSENLFGRIDIQQYYQGASRLKNFDVIPTGGIKRRAGTERLRSLDGEGRLIPFSVDRQNHFLLYLTPGRIQVIKNGVTVQTVYGTAQLSLYQSLPEIREVQYAQNFDAMILVHENYPPLMAQRDKETGVIDFAPFAINYTIETKTSGAAASVYETDKANEKYLREPGNYPRCVTFFNGRLVFAGTKNDPQRVFASRAGDIHSFATYKLFITEQREYISVFGNSFNGSDIITLGDGQAPKFVKPLDEYYCDAPYFPREYTKALYFLEEDSKKLRMSNPAIIPGALSQQELDEINHKIALYNTYEENKTKSLIGHLPESTGRQMDIYIEYGVKNMNIFFTNDYSGNHPAAFVLENNAAEYVTRDYLVTCIKETYHKKYVGGDKYLNEWAVNSAADEWLSRIRYTMQLNFRGKVLYDIPQNIWAYIAGNTTQGINSYMPFYTRNTITDRYATPDDGFTFEIASDMSDAIRWIIMNKGVIIGTETAEWIIPPEVTATSLYAALNSRYGSDKIQGAAVDDAVCFFQAGKKALAEYYIPQQDTNFRVNNMAMMSPAMLAESPAVEFDFIRAPYTKLFIIREDGTAVTLLYERSTGTFAWGRITTAGRIISVAVLPGADGNDDAYLLVERGGSYFLEVLRESSGVYLDSFERWNGANTAYTEGAVVHDAMIGYPYTSLMRSMPIIANDKMKPTNIGNLYIRFADSYMPALRLPGGQEQSMSASEPVSGVEQVYFPGGHDRTLLFELFHDRPTRCRILAIYAEAN